MSMSRQWCLWDWLDYQDERLPWPQRVPPIETFEQHCEHREERVEDQIDWLSTKANYQDVVVVVAAVAVVVG